MAGVKCTKCGAPVDIDPGERIAKCKYCDSQIFIDKSGAGFFYIIPFMLNATQAQSTFKRWSAGSRMARDLEAQAHVSVLRQSYFPVYMFRRDVGGKEQVLVRPARSTTLPGMRNLKIPPGDLKVFDQKYSVENAELIKPDMDMLAYLDSLPGKPLEQALVFFPTWVMEYAYKGQKFMAVVDGSSGEIFATDYPPRQAAPYFIIGAVSFVVFAIEGLFFPWGLVAAIPTAIAIFAGGYYVAKNL
ncbi:MAG: zinc ribbon domain-containing protein [Euryarchaeota archaeon]|nr:zinc ribbon domain-containing protein [Euryarchaeota archaeon]